MDKQFLFIILIAMTGLLLVGQVFADVNPISLFRGIDLNLTVPSVRF